MTIEVERARLLRLVEAETAQTAAITGVSALDARVLAALRDVPRHEFVPAELRHRAYDNTALPIGHGQTISQPFIVALMTHLLRPRAGHRVLEIGTGSGYQAAVLARLVRHVYSIEIVPELAADAADRLRRLGCANVTVAARDGHRGWPELAPFDGVIVTAACPAVPPALVEQLAANGRLVLPLHGHTGDRLVVVARLAGGEITSKVVLPVVFVPLTRDAGPGTPRR